MALQMPWLTSSSRLYRSNNTILSEIKKWDVVSNGPIRTQVQLQVPVRSCRTLWETWEWSSRPISGHSFAGNDFGTGLL